MKVRIFVLLTMVTSFVVATSFRSSHLTVAERVPYTELLVKNDSVLIEDFLGVNGVYHGFAFMDDPNVKVMSDQDRKTEFERVKNMELKIARTWYRPDWACGTNLYNDFNWESKRMKAFYLWLDKMKELKVDVALQAGWWFTKDTYHNTDGKQEAAPDTVKDPLRYARWVRESLHELIKVRGYDNIKYLVLFTEPLNYRSGIIPKGFTEPDYYDKVCTEIHNELKRTGLRSNVKLVGPNSGSTDTAAYVGWSVNKMNDVIDIYSWHSYNGKQFNTNPPLEYDGWKQIALAGREKIRKTGKPYWIDEYGANKPDETIRFKADYGNYLAQCVAAFINSGAQSSLLWILFDQKYAASRTTNKDSFYNGVHRWGLTRSPQDSIDNPGAPYPSWYAFSLMSKYLGGRTDSKAFKTSQADSLYVVATQPSENNISVMVVNAAHTAKKFRVKFARQPSGGLDRYLYNPAKISKPGKNEMLVSDKQIKKSDTGFFDDIPPRGVAIYTTLK
ncbi:hypothetical protein [Dyadobacter psychrotolerans]|uniref:Uncharacterized protein n=1 Tax=Dyadobacter psychrotolerans TaxID=2541721 RepID=A0A4R5DSL8_9BACT|nr:hypothetical protein [Dyadobacter psychrotolerans]TDE17422.1 hypothetical protein E0F88_05905 [Dyadobacter psychrotolerans]